MNFDNYVLKTIIEFQIMHSGIVRSSLMVDKVNAFAGHKSAPRRRMDFRQNMY